MNDTRYISWMAKLVGMSSDATRSVTELPLQPCTEDDMAKFNPPENPLTAIEVEIQRAAGNLYCLD